MTEQSTSDRLNRASNDIFEATSFLNGTNAAYIEQMYAAWLANPASVDAGWQAYFSQTGEKGLSPTQLGRGPAWKRDRRPDFASSDLIAALTGQEPPPSNKDGAPGKPGAKDAKPKPAAATGDATEAAKHSIHAVQMIRAYRMIGHPGSRSRSFGHHAQDAAGDPGSQALPVRRRHAGSADLCRRHPGLDHRHAAPVAGKAARHLLRPHRL